MNPLFQDRHQAGRKLAEYIELSAHEKNNALILALPRGGVPVGFELSQALEIPLDVLIVRKVGHPFHPEYGIGAIAETGASWMDPQAVGLSGIPVEKIERIMEKEKVEILRRVAQYRKNEPLPPLVGKTVILADDGLATGVTARVAARSIRSAGAKRIIIAVPVCSELAVESLRAEGHEVIAVKQSSKFRSASQFFSNFNQVSDLEVIALLEKAKAMQNKKTPRQGKVQIPLTNGRETVGLLNQPAKMKGLVIFAHGSGSGIASPRNRKVAAVLNQAGFGTLLIDLLTKEEAADRRQVFNIPLLAQRLVRATEWLKTQNLANELPFGYFGASTGAAAALVAAASLKQQISAVVSRGGRPDMALEHLPQVVAPTLLLVGGQDTSVIPLNEVAARHLPAAKLRLIPAATHLFKEPGTLEQVCAETTQWFLKHLAHTDTQINSPRADPRAHQGRHLIKKQAQPLRSVSDLGSLIEKLAAAKIVMLGESSHGTREFYEWRRVISQELITRYGFKFIAVEGDWPPCAAINRFIHTPSETESARALLRNFQRWPTWMWANTEMIQLTDWMKSHNAKNPTDQQVDFFGLDVYSLFESIDEVLKTLRKIDLGLARQAQLQYECFDSFKRNEKAYLKSLVHFSDGCEVQVLTALRDVLELRLEGPLAKEVFDAQQNARIVRNAEHYYRAMIHGDEDSWNVRDRHMMETLNSLLTQYGPEGKAIVWAHNTHIGDYRATDMLHLGQVNIGGLARQEWGASKVALLGFGTYQGKVMASHAWDGPAEVMTLPPGRSPSYESLFHQVSQDLHQNAFFVWLKDGPIYDALSPVMDHRAVGVVYHPASERFGNYVPTSLSQRYDGFIFVDRTKALDPLPQKFMRQEIPETWPRGF